jgi:hypothetical protein
MIKILLVVLAALAVLLGVHLLFGVVLCAATAAVWLVVERGTLTGWGVVPRGAVRCGA